MTPYTEEPCYSSQVYEFVDYLTCWLMRLGSADSLFSCFIWTTEELKAPLWKVLSVPVLIPLYLFIYILLFPVTLTAYLLWISIQHKRKPYRYAKQTKQLPKPIPKENYSFATANLCLLPEFLSRFNNSSDNVGRARKIAKRIVEQQKQVSPVLPTRRSRKQQNLPNGDMVVEPDIDHAVLEEFPRLDILIIQEAWTSYCCQDMIKELISVFPYIIYDGIVTSWRSNRFLGNSGLMIASKYPILEVNFNWFKDKCFADLYSSKGLLQIKVGISYNNLYLPYMSRIQ